jgi:hypothetical protein
MTAALVWICWGLVALGVLLVLGAVFTLPGRVRPLRRALRRLSWRRAELDRLRTSAENLQDRVATLHAQAGEVLRRPAQPSGGRHS